MATPASSRTRIAKRRSSRIALITPIGLSGQDSQRCSFMTAAMATNLNRHGAAIQLPRQLAVGSTLIVRNANGAQVFAKVVGQLAVSQALCSYGIEFIETSGAAMTFWGISFPKPEDRAAMAKATEDAGIARRGAEND